MLLSPEYENKFNNAKTLKGEFAYQANTLTKN